MRGRWGDKGEAEGTVGEVVWHLCLLGALCVGIALLVWPVGCDEVRAGLLETRVACQTDVFSRR